MGRADVLLATGVSAPTAASTWSNTSCLADRSSTTLSITKSHPANSRQLVTGTYRSGQRPRSEGSKPARRTRSSMARATYCRASSWVFSLRVKAITRLPCPRRQAAIPRPRSPRPATATVWISIIVTSRDCAPDDDGPDDTYHAVHPPSTTRHVPVT